MTLFALISSITFCQYSNRFIETSRSDKGYLLKQPAFVLVFMSYTVHNTPRRTNPRSVIVLRCCHPEPEDRAARGHLLQPLTQMELLESCQAPNPYHRSTIGVAVVAVGGIKGSLMAALAASTCRVATATAPAWITVIGSEWQLRKRDT